MIYRMKPLACDSTKLPGLSEKQIVCHYKNNYGDAVKRLNAITAELAAPAFAHGQVRYGRWGAHGGKLRVAHPTGKT